VSQQAKSSRMEKQVRNQARGLFLASATLLIACTTMSAIYGWSLGNAFIDSAAFAMAFATADVGGAYLMSFSGTCTANKETSAARRSAFAAAVCMLLTFFGILGFQSENRENQVSSKERAIKVVDSFIGWAKDTAITKEPAAKDKTKPGAITAGIEAVGKAVERQVGMLKSGEISAESDGQATTLANITGMDKAKSRSWTILIVSAALLFIQYSLWWAYGFLRHRLEPAVSALTHGPRGLPNSGHFPNSVEKVSRAEAKLDVQRQISAGIELCNAEYAERWGVNESVASKWQTEFAQEGVMRKAQRGRRKVAVAPTRPNGLHVVA
jgi:hypothetical protein